MATGLFFLPQLLPHAFELLPGMSSPPLELLQLAGAKPLLMTLLQAYFGIDVVAATTTAMPPVAPPVAPAP